jgi:GntR family transcriptional repressor for pyruvate dehydrogenase complex
MAGVEAAGLAAERANQDDIAKMTRVVQKSEKEQTRDTQAAAAIHLSFHRALVNATQNPVLSQMYNMLVALISRSLGLSSAPEELAEDERQAFLAEIFAGHRKVLGAVKSHNPATARKAMHKHYDCMEAVTPRV